MWQSYAVELPGVALVVARYISSSTTSSKCKWQLLVALVCCKLPESITLSRALNVMKALD